jgi:hypothetical protein
VVAVSARRTGTWERILNLRDWSAAIREFNLASAILIEKYSAVTSIILQIGQSGEIMNQVYYHQWPLFIDFG